MSNVNVAKRAAHERRVRGALQAILNDPSVMPNADCVDLFVSVSRVAFGRTIAEIFIEVSAHPRRPPDKEDEPRHERYAREAKRDGKSTYADFDEVFHFPALTQVIERELQRRLGLLYTPTIRPLSEIGRSGDRSRRE